MEHPAFTKFLFFLYLQFDGIIFKNLNIFVFFIFLIAKLPISKITFHAAVTSFWNILDPDFGLPGLMALGWLHRFSAINYHGFYFECCSNCSNNRWIDRKIKSPKILFYFYDWLYFDSFAGWFSFYRIDGRSFELDGVRGRVRS